MCGISGIINKNNLKVSLNEIKPMTDAIVHRGPDGEGFYFGDNFAFGHRRLSIIDLSSAGHQPMEYIDRYVITYNGEIYNYLELKYELQKQGYVFNTHTDTEVIIASYDFWGVDCLNKFNGMWAFVIYDKNSNEFFMSRDRFGKKPFYYYKDNDVFIFASEIKAILTHPVVDAIPNLIYIKEYIKHGAREFFPDTAFENIYRFDFASYCKADIDEIFSDFKMTKFWQLDTNLKNEKFDQKQAKEYARKYYDLLEDSVRMRLRADVKVGSALSGGLDSSSIVYIINKILKEQGKEELQETFSSVYKSDSVRDCDESFFIDQVADSLGVHSNQIEPNINNVVQEYHKVLYMMENPQEGSAMSGWHTFGLAASTNVKVTLDGQGADEQLAGYLPYIINHISSLNLLNAICESYKFLSIPDAKKFIAKGLIVSIFKNIFGTRCLKFVLKHCLGKDIELELNKKLTQDINQNLITLIHYSDHVSMAYSIESRMPFMDYRIVEFLASVPACYKINNGWTKYLARLAFDGKLPDEIVWRKDKIGWAIPHDFWFKGELKNWLVKKVADSKILHNLYPDINIEQILYNDVKTALRYLNIAIWEEVFIKND